MMEKSILTIMAGRSKIVVSLISLPCARERIFGSPVQGELRRRW